MSMFVTELLGKDQTNLFFEASQVVLHYLWLLVKDQAFSHNNRA
jgi:hypothetical protein